MNTNAAYMEKKYGISHMIAAFPYEVIGLSDGRYSEGQKQDGKIILRAETFPWRLCHDLSDDLWKMAGWNRGDNKCVYLVVKDHEPTLIGFYDLQVTLVTFSHFWNEVPGNVYRGRDKINPLYQAWLVQRTRERAIEQNARLARTIAYQ
jgi:hypothetical protein